MHAVLLPYQKKGFKEQDLFKFDFEENTESDIDLEAEIKSIEEQKEYWKKVDEKRSK